MGRGLGDVQRAALTALHDARDNQRGMWSDELALALGLTPARTSTVIRSLVARVEGVQARREHTGEWQGAGVRVYGKPELVWCDWLEEPGWKWLEPYKVECHLPESLTFVTFEPDPDAPTGLGSWQLTLRARGERGKHVH